MQGTGNRSHIMFIDSHCHINFPELAEQMPDLLARMRENKVSHALCVSVDLPTLPQVLEIAAQHDNVYASVGVHPDYEDTPEPSVDDLVRLAATPKVVAIGETGLDYYRLEGRSIEDMEWQRERFRTHIRAARVTGKPLIIHTRSAADDTLRLMREEEAGEPAGVMHCFTESWDVAKGALDQNFYISFSGIVTFKSARDLQDVARRVPLDRMLIETDSPYLAPVPYRGKLNQPGYVRHVAEFIADLRGEPLQKIAEATSENFFRLFATAKH
ncbi:DNAase [Pandoraea commovens]|uniref:DNAase n=2 Tax=Pandoraea commovens TaxID=2508289 RepID=A0A5E4S630_9BURK|nr:DNAase [Pandoraea commovens]